MSSTNLYFTGSFLWWATGEQIGYNRLFTFHKFFLKQKSQVTFNESRHPVIFSFAALKTSYTHQLHLLLQMHFLEKHLKKVLINIEKNWNFSFTHLNEWKYVFLFLIIVFIGTSQSKPHVKFYFYQNERGCYVIITLKFVTWKTYWYNFSHTYIIIQQ